MESAMSIFQRIVLLIKVLVILSLGAASAAWAGCPEQDQDVGFSTGTAGSGFHAVYADDPEDDETDEEEEEGDSQT
jgi:hypothetical protein